MLRLVRACWLLCGAFLLTLLIPAPASAQGLLWNLPQSPGTFAKYQGTFTNTQERPQSNEGPLELSFDTELTITMLAETTETVDGMEIPCRWVEFRYVMGKGTEAGIQAGPYGVRVLKVLIPVPHFQGKTLDENGLPVTYVPIVRGYRKIGNRPAAPLSGKVLAVYPLFALLGDYQDLAPAAEEPEDLDLPPIGTIPARLYQGSESQESILSRTSNEGKIWRTDDIPFGWVKYEATVLREEKDATASRDEFAKTAELKATLSLVEIGANGTSVIPEDEAPLEPDQFPGNTTEEPAAE